jgi:hypothetical protein
MSLPEWKNINAESSAPITKLEQVQTREDFKRLFEDTILKKRPFEVKQFIEEVAKNNPEFASMLETLIQFQESRTQNFNNEPNNDVKAYQAREIVKDTTLWALDSSSEREKLLSKLSSDTFKDKDWNYYFWVIFWKEWKDTQVFGNRLKEFADLTKTEIFKNFSPVDQLKSFVRLIGKDIEKLIQVQDGASILWKLEFLQAYLKKVWANIDLRELLSTWIAEAPDKQKLSELALLADIAYLDDNSYKRNDARTNNPDDIWSAANEQFKREFWEWKKIILASSGTETLRQDPTTFKQIMKTKYPWLPLEFHHLWQNGTNEQKNLELLEASYKVVQLQQQKERTERLAQNADVLNNFVPLTRDSNFTSGFSASAFQNTRSGEIIISVRWTDGLFPLNPDLWWNDLIIWLSKVFKDMRPTQLSDLRKFIKNFSEQFAWKIAQNKITIVWHSLGGNLAEYTSTSAVKLPDNMRGRTRSINFNWPGTNNGSVTQTAPSFRISNTDGIGNFWKPIWYQIATETTASGIGKHYIDTVQSGIAKQTASINVPLIQSILKESL